jgi:hypothetical protein
MLPRGPPSALAADAIAIKEHETAKTELTDFSVKCRDVLISSVPRGCDIPMLHTPTQHVVHIDSLPKINSSRQNVN